MTAGTEIAVSPAASASPAEALISFLRRDMRTPVALVRLLGGRRIGDGYGVELVDLGDVDFFHERNLGCSESAGWIDQRHAAAMPGGELDARRGLDRFGDHRGVDDDRCGERIDVAHVPRPAAIVGEVAGVGDERLRKIADRTLRGMRK